MIVSKIIFFFHISLDSYLKEYDVIIIEETVYVTGF